LSVDYHDRVCVIRWLDCGSGRDQVFKEVPTTAEALTVIVDQALRAAGPQGQVTWIQESTTGWARIQQLLDPRVRFVLANVLQMPLPPKAKRRKTDTIDTARMQREFLAGTLPRAHQPPAAWRQLRRLVAYREGLVNRRTALRNWIDRYLAHETWVERRGLWSRIGQQRLRSGLKSWPSTDVLILAQKLDELARLEEQLQVAQDALEAAYATSAAAQRLDAIAGIGTVAAISIVARIGPVQRFFAGLAPGVAQSDRTRRDGHLGGGGTDRHLRHYLIEASVWARQLPRYNSTYERIKQRKGPKVGRLVVARMVLRSIYKLLKDGVAFDPGVATPEPVAARC
jgi:transposase